MLKFDGAGWGTISIGDWSDRCSYMDDVPYALLEAVEETIRTGHKTVCEFDAEGYGYTIVFGYYETIIITTDKEDGGHSIITADVHIYDLAQALIADIRSDLEAWAKWPGDILEDEIDERKADFGVLCDMIEKRVK